MKTSPNLILASTSKYRQQQLAELGLTFESLAPDFDEENFKTNAVSPEELTKKLAYGKANSLKRQQPNSIILGGDQVVAFKDKILGKAGTPEKAIEQLLSLSDSSHKLITSICLITPEKIYEHTNVTQIHMRKLSPKLAKHYVKQNSTWQCAGSYKFECQPALIVKEIESTDPTSIIGIPTFKLVSWLTELNYFDF